MTNETTHLVLGDVAAGVLREAMTVGLPAAPILRFRDIYCLGPLAALDGDGGPASRARYWAQLLPDAPPSAAEFAEEEARYAQAAEAARRGTVVVWAGAHSSARLWLQRLCAMLAPQAAAVRVVDAFDRGAAHGGRRSVSQFEPGELGELLADARALGTEELTRLAAQWRHDRAVASGVRRWTGGRVSHHGDDFYDALLLIHCDDEWQAADQVIGSAQWDCDEFLGDVFFAWRLRCLAASGRLLWRSPGGAPDEAVVRLAGAGGAAGTEH